MRPALKPLSEQVIVITGASSGIGLATARAAARAGAKVMLAARNEAVLRETEQAILESGGMASYAVTDVTRREDIEALADATVEAYGRFDTWVNDAGLGIFGKLADISEEDHRQVFDTNFWGLVNGSLVAAEHLRCFGGGAIINLGSVVSDIGFPIQGMYSASKHAVKGFTDAFRMELMAENAPISVTLIKPTSINTPFPQNARNATDGKPSLPPPVYTAEDVAEAILHAAVHGGRDIYVGGAGKIMSSLNKILPGVVDWFGSTFVPGQSVKQGSSGRDNAGNLYTAGNGGESAGDSEHLVMRSAYTKAALHPVLTGALAATAVVAAASLLNRSNRS